MHGSEAPDQEDGFKCIETGEQIGRAVLISETKLFLLGCVWLMLNFLIFITSFLPLGTSDKLSLLQLNLPSTENTQEFGPQ